MDYRNISRNDKEEVTALFRSVFSASEGSEEGTVIGRLVAQLSDGVDGEDVVGFAACRGDSLVGAIFFTRLRFARDIQVFMLAPVAVSTLHQGKGIGQALIRHGLNELRRRSVAVVVTYGDPGYYTKAGFQALSESVIRAPLELSMPGGWLGLSLTEDPIPALEDRPTCVQAFNDPVYW
jgi:predicted N-acetyltransferase YhbS